MNISISFQCFDNDIDKYYNNIKDSLSKLELFDNPSVDYTDGIGSHPTICIHIKNINVDKVFNIFRDIDMDLNNVHKITFVCGSYQMASKIRDHIHKLYYTIIDSVVVEEYPPGSKSISSYVLRITMTKDNNKCIKWKDLFSYNK